MSNIDRAKNLLKEAKEVLSVDRDTFRNMDSDLAQNLEDGYYNAADGINKLLEHLKGQPELLEEYKLWSKIDKLANKSELGRYL